MSKKILYEKLLRLPFDGFGFIYVAFVLFVIYVAYISKHNGELIADHALFVAIVSSGAAISLLLSSETDLEYFPPWPFRLLSLMFGTIAFGTMVAMLIL